MNRTDRGIGSPAFAKAIGATFRQVDYWVRTGMLVPSISQSSGSGSQRRWSTRDVAVGRVVTALIGTGISHRTVRVVAEVCARLTEVEWQGFLVIDGRSVRHTHDPARVLADEAIVMGTIVSLGAVVEPEEP